MKVSWNGGTPKSSIYRWDCPWNKPSSELGDTPFMQTTIFHQHQPWIHRIGRWDNFHRKPLYLMVKTYGFPVKMFPNKPIHWYEGYHGTVDHCSWLNPMKSQFFNINHGRNSPETPIFDGKNLWVSGFQMFPKKPIHQRIFHRRFPGWWIISAEGLGLIGDSKSSWEKRLESPGKPYGKHRDVQKPIGNWMV